MKIIYIKGNLVDVMPRQKALDITSGKIEFGVGKVRQIAQTETHSFIECLDETKIPHGLTLLNIAEANAKITEVFIPRYTVKNEGLMTANINQLVTAETLDLSTFDGVWDSQQEFKTLYETYNVSGIEKSVAPLPFVELEA